MKVAVNDFISGRGVSGSSRASSLVQDALAQHYDVLRLTGSERSAGRIRRLFGMVGWDLIGAPRRALREKADLIVHMTNTGGSLGTPSIAVIHDTMVLDHKDLFSAGFRIYARVMFSHAVRASRIVVTPSAHSANGIRKHWPRARIVVIPWPAPQVHEAILGASDRNYGQVLVVSSVDKHKRLPIAVQAVRELRNQGFPLTLHMVLRPGNDQDALDEAIGADDRSWITIQQKIPEGDLRNLYRQSWIVMVPSLDEGYCLPAIEAAAVGTPVVHVDGGAVAEVVPWIHNDAGFYAGDLSLLIERARLMLDPKVWTVSSQDALRSSASFNWDKFSRAWCQVAKDAVG